MPRRLRDVDSLGRRSLAPHPTYAGTVVIGTNPQTKATVRHSIFGLGPRTYCSEDLAKTTLKVQGYTEITTAPLHASECRCVECQAEVYNK